MKVETSIKNKRRAMRRYLAFGLGLFLFAIYLFTYRGGFHSIDEVSMFAVTESLVKFGRLNTNQIAWTQWATTQAEAQGFFGADGHVYSKKGLALSLVQAPFYWLALILPGLGMLQTVSLLNAGITAVTGMLVFMFVHRLNFSLITALVTALIFGLATIVFAYAKYLFSEPLAGFLLLVAAYMLFAYRQEGGLRHVVIAGLAAGFAVVARANNLFLLPAFGLYLLWIEYKRVNGQASSVIRPFINIVIAFGVALAVPALVILLYNYLRSGNPFQTGYDLTLFSLSPVLGLYKLLFSPLRGLFIYSPILLFSLPGWWMFRKTNSAEAWLFAGVVGITLALFSFWSSGEGLSWGSRFLVPLIPFFAICLAPIIQLVINNEQLTIKKEKTSSATSHIPHPASLIPHRILCITFYFLLAISFIIQILAAAINPWVFLSKIQAEFGGEFFLEKTAALYDFSYSQIAGQLQAWSLENSDVAWWQTWGFDPLAFALSFGLVILSGWLLWQQITHRSSRFLLPVTIILAAGITYFLLARYNITDLQFGPPDDSYTQTLNIAAGQAAPGDSIITVHDNSYHVAMNRFKRRVPLIGFAQQQWPLPDTAIRLLETATSNQTAWLITIGFQPARPDNAAEQWLTLNTYKATDEWLPDEIRLVKFGTIHPNTERQIDAVLNNEIELTAVKLLDAAQPGQTLPVEFIWKPNVTPQADYNLFLQLLNVEGALVAQHDSSPNGGYSPTSLWEANRQVASRHALDLPADLPAGDYRLIAGLYNPITGQRLTNDTGSNIVELGNITIQSRGTE